MSAQEHAQPAPAQPGSGAAAPNTPTSASAQPASGPPREIGGRQGPEPTRYGDWELRGRCIDF